MESVFRFITTDTGASFQDKVDYKLFINSPEFQESAKWFNEEKPTARDKALLTRKALRYNYPQRPSEGPKAYRERLDAYRSVLYANNVNVQGVSFIPERDLDNAIYNHEPGRPILTLPGHNYLGPGNELGAVSYDLDDVIAKEHDISYGHVNTFEGIKKADTHAISDFVGDVIDHGNLHSGLGALGLIAKQGVEKIIGHPIYPSSKYVYYYTETTSLSL